jgi:hypothetical protein
MGNTCAGIRRSRLSQYRHSLPPPYEPGKRSTISSDLLDKEDPPELSTHPALRDQRLLDQVSITTQYRASDNVQLPESAHLGARPAISNAHSARLSELTVLSREDTVISASTTPLWRWNNSQCRTWLAAVLVEYAGRSPDVAKELVVGSPEQS